MNSKSNIFGCRKCFQRFKFFELSDPMQFCQTCKNSNDANESNYYKQCNYCKSDYKKNIPGDVCLKCKRDHDKNGEPSQCNICKLQMVFGNAVICARCSHYRSKFGDARECDNCCQMSAFYKDNVSRDKVDGKVLCWLCTYYYKVSKSKNARIQRDKRSDVIKIVDAVNPVEEVSLPRTDSTNSLLSAEPINKRSRLDDESSMMIYSHDSMYNDHLMKVNTLQEDIKQFRRRIAAKDNELLAKESQITGLKADLSQKDSDFNERITAMKDRWEKERQGLTEKIRTLQRENVNIMKSGKKRRPADAGLHFMSKNPLTRVQQMVSNSPEVSAGTNSKEVSSAEDSPR